MKTQRVFLKSIALLVALVIGTVATPTGTTRAASAPMTGLTPEQVEAAVEEYFDAVGALDLQRYVNTFAPDGVLEDPVGTPPIQGTAAITAYVANLFVLVSEVKHKIQDISVCGNEAAVDWKISVKTTTGKHIIIDGMGVFKFNEAGKLQSVREFWDLQAFLAQL